ncbi:MAG: hypothetical protein JSV89_19335 [Spirochaetaceae bacterium]|nr:MAG: hypothetical protein JSV89_19335 [Spirochaetaceae bacterium]
MKIPIPYNHSPLELIRTRTSVRRFNGEILAGEPRRELEHCCEALKLGPFGGACRFRLVDKRSQDSGHGERVGAYGTIWGARTYLAGAAKESDHALEDFGYLFELLLLKATDLDVSSCWLGGIFSRGRFARAIGLQEGEILPAVSPIGVPTRYRSIYDRVVRWGAGSKHRKPWAELYFDARTGTPLSPDRAGPFATPLEMVRLAPSASNRQPWRCLTDGETIHFYLQRFPGYRSINATDLQRIDMGIAMSHFDLAVEIAEIEGQWRVVDPPSIQRPDAWQKAEYLVSWVRKPRGTAGRGTAGR